MPWGGDKKPHFDNKETREKSQNIKVAPENFFLEILHH